MVNSEPKSPLYWRDRCQVAEREADRLRGALREAEKGIGSLLFVMNNMHNYGKPNFKSFAEAAEDDARRALDLIGAV